MEISREKGFIDKVDISFRYVLKEESLALQLLNELSKINVKIEYYPPKRSLNYVIVIDNTDLPNDDLILEINQKLGLPNSSFGFWFGINSDFDNGGISVPESIIKSIRNIGGQLDFSFFTSR